MGLLLEEPIGLRLLIPKALQSYLASEKVGLDLLEMHKTLSSSTLLLLNRNVFELVKRELPWYC